MLAWIDAYKLSTEDVTPHIELPIYFKDHFLYFCRHLRCRYFCFKTNPLAFGAGGYFLSIVNKNLHILQYTIFTLPFFFRVRANFVVENSPDASSVKAPL